MISSATSKCVRNLTLNLYRLSHSRPHINTQVNMIAHRSFCSTPPSQPFSSEGLWKRIIIVCTGAGGVIGMGAGAKGSLQSNELLFLPAYVLGGGVVGAGFGYLWGITAPISFPLFALATVSKFLMKSNQISEN